MRYLASVAHGQLGYSFTRHETVLEALTTDAPAHAAADRPRVRSELRHRDRRRRRSGGAARLVVRPHLVRRIGRFLFAAGFLGSDDGPRRLRVVDASCFPPGTSSTPLHDYMSPSRQIVDRLRHLVLPVGALTLLTTAAIARYQRAAMLEVLPADFIRTARAKGLPERDDPLAPRAPHGPHTDGDARRARSSPPCSAARCSSSACSTGRAWA